MSSYDIDPIEPKPLPPSDNSVFDPNFQSKLDPFFRADYRDVGRRKWYTDYPKSFSCWSGQF